MKFMRLPPRARDEYLTMLSGFPAYVERVFSGLPPARLCCNSQDGGFSPVEQVWHLADLEEEGFTTRINALLAGNAPHLPDFDGDRAARERNYKSLSFSDGLEKFRAARIQNTERFRAMDMESWNNPGHLAGVGKITLCDIPSFMHQHDQSHRQEIEAWLATAG